MTVIEVSIKKIEPIGYWISFQIIILLGHASFRKKKYAINNRMCAFKEL